MKKLKKIKHLPLKAAVRVRRMNVKMLKVCFGPCRCFSAAKR